MRRGAFVVAEVLLCAGLGAPAASAQTDAVAVARALIDAENAHDVGAAVDLFAPGAIVKLPTGPLLTRAEIERWQRELAAGNLRADISTPVAVTPEVVTFTGTIAYDPFRRLGIPSLDATWLLTVQLGRVTVFDFNFTPAATARLQAALAGGTAPAPGSGTPSGQSTPAGATSGRALALTGASLAPAAAAVGAILLGMLLVLAPVRVTGSGGQ